MPRPKGVKSRPYRYDVTTKQCEECGASFISKRDHGKYCSCKCRKRVQNRKAKAAGVTEAGKWSFPSFLDQWAVKKA